MDQLDFLYNCCLVAIFEPENVSISFELILIPFVVSYSLILNQSDMTAWWIFVVIIEEKFFETHISIVCFYLVNLYA